jgi:hypothetical protein
VNRTSKGVVTCRGYSLENDPKCADWKSIM